MNMLYRRGIEMLRQPDRNPRCYELTEQEKLIKIQELQSLLPVTVEQEQLANTEYYGA